MNPGHTFTPDGWPRVVPRIVVPDARRLVEFVKEVFGATGEYEPERPAVLAIGGSRLMISDVGEREPSPAFLYVYVADADDTWRRAVAAGAISIEPPAEMPYGDRRAMVRDAWGNTWQIATHRRTSERRI
jgi:PhnB protein